MKIKRLLAGISTGVLMFAAFAMPALAVKPNGPSAANGLDHPGQASQLELYEKDPFTWEPVEDGAWGKMTLNKGFVFNGHELEANTEYALIVYDQDADDDPNNEWPGEGPVLATGSTNNMGDIHLSGDLPELEEAKIWLVLASDVDKDGIMTAWNPTEYLFEYDRVSH